MDMVSKNGVIDLGMMENGFKMICTEKEDINGQMEKSILEIMFIIRKKVMEHTSGQMVKSIREIGKTEFNMEKEYTRTQKVFHAQAYGTWVIELNGLEKYKGNLDLYKFKIKIQVGLIGYKKKNKLKICELKIY